MSKVDGGVRRSAKGASLPSQPLPGPFTNGPYGIVDLFVTKGASMELASGCFYVLVAVGGYWGFGYLVVVGDFEGSDYGSGFFN